MIAVLDRTSYATAECAEERRLAASLARGDPMLESLGAVALLVGLWIAAPTLRTFLRQSWAPVPRNDAIVFQAQQSSHP